MNDSSLIINSGDMSSSLPLLTDLLKVQSSHVASLEKKKKKLQLLEVSNKLKISLLGAVLLWLLLYWPIGIYEKRLISRKKNCCFNWSAIYIYINPIEELVHVKLKDDVVKVCQALQLQQGKEIELKYNCTAKQNRLEILLSKTNQLKHLLADMQEVSYFQCI